MSSFTDKILAFVYSFESQARAWEIALKCSRNPFPLNSLQTPTGPTPDKGEKIG